MVMKKLQEDLFKRAYEKHEKGQVIVCSIDFHTMKTEGQTAISGACDLLVDYKVMEKVDVDVYRITGLGVQVYEKYGCLQPHLDKIPEESTKVAIHDSHFGDGNVIGSIVAGDVSTTKFDVNIAIEQAIKAIEQSDIPDEEKSWVIGFLKGATKTIANGILGQDILPYIFAVVKDKLGMPPG